MRPLRTLRRFMLPLATLLSLAVPVAQASASPSGAAGARSEAPAPPSACATPAGETPAGPLYRCMEPGTKTSPPLVFLLHVPPSNHGDLPLVVFLHGCTQDGLDAAYGTGFDQLADRDGFLVVYPQQTTTPGSTAPLSQGNGIGCWNWFLGADQDRGRGEPATIARITEQVAAAEQADPRRIYVAGFSAGADMAVVMGATYPDLYAAIGAVAGCAYRTCTDLTGKATVHAMGPRARVVPAFVLQGTADTVNPFPLGQGLVTSWLLADRAIAERHHEPPVRLLPASVRTYELPKRLQPLGGDTCIHPSSFPCPGGVAGFSGSYPFTVERYLDHAGHVVLEFVVVHGLEHAYPGGHYDAATGLGTFTDPLGPPATEMLWHFFSASSAAKDLAP